ncbi:MAG: AMIN domain-containing protein [Desulfobulbaceae bacterium]
MKRHTILLCAMLAVFLCAPFPATASASPLIEKIEFDTSNTNVDRITFKLNSSNLPQTFALKGPPRVVFDFPGTALAKGVKTNIPAAGKFIKGVRSAEHRGDKAKTRVVLDVATEEAIDFKQDFNAESNTLVISIFALGSKPPPAAVAAAPEKQKAPEAALEKGADAGKPAPPPPAPGKPVAAKETAPVPTPVPVPAVPPAAKDKDKDKDKVIEPAVAAIPKPEAGAESAKEEGTVIQPLSEIGPKQTAKESTKPVLYSIEFDKDANRGETINFKLNTFNPPVVFGIEEDTPRIVCFFKDTAAGPELGDTIGAQGRFVKSIQVGKYSNPDNVRVVLDLVPNLNYDLQQVFFKEENMFMIIINTSGEKTAGQQGS